MRRFIVQCKKEVAFFLIANVLWAAIGISLAFILQYVTDTAMTGAMQRVPLIIAMILVYLAADTMFEFFSSYTSAVLNTKVSLLFRNALVRRIQKSSVEEKEKRGDADYLSLLNNNVSEVESEYVYGVQIIFFQIISLLFALIATTYIQPLLTLIFIVLAMVPLLAPQLLKKKLETVNRDALASKSRYLNVLNELLEGFQALKVFGRERNYAAYHEAQNEDFMKKTQYNYKWRRWSMSLSYGMGNMVILGTWGIGLIFTLSGSISFSQLIALTTLMNMVAGPFQIISERYSDILAGKAIAEDLLHYIDERQDDDIQYKSLVPHVDQIQLQHVSVIRDEHCILKDINVRIQQNQNVGIIGNSGSGKSTLLKTIAGILSVQEGEITVNGQIVSNEAELIHPDSILIAQDTTIFSATIGENISMFKPCRAERIRQAIEKAGLTTWFRRNGEDVNQEIEKSKANLSGGEMRRMDFARTILQEKSQILLFDEPTAGLDAYNAQNIMEQICNMKQGMRIVATHNLAEENMRRFDWIYMIEQGEIVLEGKPEVILQAPAYQKLKQGKQ